MEKLSLDTNKTLGIAWFVLSLLVSVTNDALMKLLSGGIPTYEVVFLRFLFGTLTLVPFIFINRKSFVTSRIMLHVIRGGGFFLAISIWCSGLTVGKLAVATTINFTIPIFILLLAARFLKERLSPAKILATIIGFVGIIVIMNPTAADFNIKTLLLVGSAFLFASLDVINKKFVSSESMLSMLFYSNLFAMLFSVTPGVYSWVTPDITSFALLLVLGAGGNLILYCLLKSFSCVEVSAVAPYRYFELLFSIIFGYVFFSEKFDVANWIGAGVIILSTLIISYEYLLVRHLKRNKA